MVAYLITQHVVRNDFNLFHERIIDGLIKSNIDLALYKGKGVETVEFNTFSCRVYSTDLGTLLNFNFLLDFIPTCLGLFKEYKNGKYFFSRNIVSLLHEIILISNYRKIIKKNSITKLFAVNFNYDLHLAFAANTLSVETIAMQHSIWYGYRLPERYHEWPSTTIFVFDSKRKQYHDNHYDIKSIVAGELWKLKFPYNNIIQDEVLVIYESDNFSFTVDLLLKLTERINPNKIRIRPHPWKIKFGNSIGSFVSQKYLWAYTTMEKMPLVAVCLGSTAHSELLYYNVNSFYVIGQQSHSIMGTKVPFNTFVIKDEIDLVQLVDRIEEAFNSVKNKYEMQYPLNIEYENMQSLMNIAEYLKQ
jgi:hypothetical protein